jgi:hypothetical protein
MVPGRHWNDVSEDEPREGADDGWAKDLGSVEDQAVAGAMIAADDMSIGIRLLTSPDPNDEV